MIGDGTSPYEHDALPSGLDDRIGHGDGGNEGPGVRHQRLAVNATGIGQLDDPAQIHDGHAVRRVPNGAQVVRDEQIREVPLALQPLHQIEDLRLNRHVERRNRLVSDNEIRIGGEGARNADPLLLPTVQTSGGGRERDNVIGGPRLERNGDPGGRTHWGRSRMGNAVLLVFLIVQALDGAAGQSTPSRPAPSLPNAVASDGPLAPVPPAVINRDATGRVAVRAVSLASPLKIDGRLDEAVYGQVASMSGFIQNDPKEGAPAEEKTEVWVFFDRDNVYVVCRCWETHPERLVANELRRDNSNIVQNDNFAWSFDTFLDRRNNFLFEVSAAGGRIDAQVTNERQLSFDYNPIWQTKAGRFEGGYVIEAAIPFKSLRYKSGATQTWGFQVRRHSSWRNENSYLSPVPASVGPQGVFRSSMSATLFGLEAPSGSKNLELKPYATAHMTTDKTVSQPIINDPDGDVGIDAKYGVTQSLTAGFTYNTDFAQVEADEQ